MAKKLALFVLIAILLFATFILSAQGYAAEIDATVEVTHVIDGETFKISSNATVRLADIKTLNDEENGRHNSTVFLRDLIEGKKVLLDIDNENTTSATDELVCVAYISINDTYYKNVNKALLQANYAVIENFANDFNPYAWTLDTPKDTVRDNTAGIDPATFEDLRMTLMNHCNSEIVTHAGYIIALTVGLLSLASIFFGPQKFIETKYRKCMFAGVLAFAIGLILYFIVRILYWTNLNNLVMIISANNLNIDSNSPTYISALNNAAIGQMGRDATQNWLINLAFLTKDYNYLWMLLPAILLAFPIDFFLNFNLFKNKLKTMFKNKPKTTIALASITGVISAIAVYLVQTFYYNPQWTILLIIVAVVVIIDVVLLIIKLNKSARLLFYSIKVRLG